MRVILKHPRGVAPERVPRADATDGSVRDRRALRFWSEGFSILHHDGGSRAEALGVNAKTAGPGLPGTPN